MTTMTTRDRTLGSGTDESSNALSMSPTL
jgi:hypothetical protein